MGPWILSLGRYISRARYEVTRAPARAMDFCLRAIVHSNDRANSRSECLTIELNLIVLPFSRHCRSALRDRDIDRSAIRVSNIHRDCFYGFMARMHDSIFTDALMLGEHRSSSGVASTLWRPSLSGATRRRSRRCTSADKQVTILLRRFPRRAVPSVSPLFPLPRVGTVAAIGPHDKRAARGIIFCVSLRAWVRARTHALWPSRGAAHAWALVGARPRPSQSREKHRSVESRARAMGSGERNADKRGSDREGTGRELLIFCHCKLIYSMGPLLSPRAVHAYSVALWGPRCSSLPYPSFSPLCALAPSLRSPARSLPSSSTFDVAWQAATCHRSVSRCAALRRAFVAPFFSPAKRGMPLLFSRSSTATASKILPCAPFLDRTSPEMLVPRRSLDTSRDFLESFTKTRN